MAKKIIFLGAPGVGKGAVAKLIVEKLGIPQISTGDLLREAAEQGTEFGNKAKSYMDSGQLVPDELIIGLLEQRIAKKDCKNGFILDGFPRTISQAEALDSSNIMIDKAIHFVAGREVVVQRLSGRRICKKCGAIFHIQNIPPKQEGICDNCGGELFQRDDDKPEAIKNRLKVYGKQTAPVIRFYRSKGNLAEIDAADELDIIVENTLKALGE